MTMSAAKKVKIVGTLNDCPTLIYLFFIWFWGVGQSHLEVSYQFHVYANYSNYKIILSFNNYFQRHKMPLLRKLFFFQKQYPYMNGCIVHNDELLFLYQVEYK